MANFLLIYTGGNSGQPGSDAERAAILKSWTDWFAQLGGDLVDPGNPTSPQVKNITANGRVADGPIGTPVTGYSIIKADSLDAAVSRAKGCPQLAAGGQISVYETFSVM